MARLCSIKGCGGKHLAKGFCRTHYPSKKRPTYQTWRDMHRRCNNPNHVGYSRYGGRGIKVCKRWSLYANFLADMGERPEGKSIDRIDNDRGYSPSNCRWATRDEQLNNRNRTTLVTIKGTTKSLVQWADEVGIRRRALRSRYDRGQTSEALLKPLRDAKTVTLGGVTRTLAEWSCHTGTSAQGMRWRLRKGHAAEAVVYGTGHRKLKRMGV